MDLEFDFDSENHVSIFTDGACSNNGTDKAKAGIGVWWGCGHPNNISEPLRGKPTNNRAEICATIRAINQAARLNYESVTIHTDSHYVYECVTNYLDKWEKNGWINSKNKPVKNKEDLLELMKAMKKIKTYWHKVEPYCIDCMHGNNGADRLAKDGIHA